MLNSHRMDIGWPIARMNQGWMRYISEQSMVVGGGGKFHTKGEGSRFGLEEGTNFITEKGISGGLSMFKQTQASLLELPACCLKKPDIHLRVPAVATIYHLMENASS